MENTCSVISTQSQYNMVSQLGIFQDKPTYEEALLL